MVKIDGVCMMSKSTNLMSQLKRGFKNVGREKRSDVSIGEKQRFRKPILIMNIGESDNILNPLKLSMKDIKSQKNLNSINSELEYHQI